MRLELPGCEVQPWQADRFFVAIGFANTVIAEDGYTGEFLAPNPSAVMAEAEEGSLGGRSQYGGHERGEVTKPACGSKP